MLEDPGLVPLRLAINPHVESKEYNNVPSVEPNSPRIITAIRSQGPTFFFPGPEEQSIVGMAGTVDRDVARPIAPDGERHVRERVRHLEV